MHNKIAITGDLASLFAVLSLAEYRHTLSSFDPKIIGMSYSDYKKIKKEETKAIQHRADNSNLFSTLTHLLIMYDYIELPVLETSINLNSDISTIASRIYSGNLNWVYPTDYWFFPLEYCSLFREDFIPNDLSISPDESVIPLKPLVINNCLKGYTNYSYLSLFAEYTVGSLENLYNYIFDWFFNNANLDTNHYIDILLGTEPLNKEIDIFGRKTISIATARIKESLRNLLLIQDIAKKETCDFYTPAFSSFYTTTNAEDAYCILKTQISMIMEEQPAFESLTDILRFREKESFDIKLLRDEVSALESLLVQGEREQAIQKAINDVRSANQSLIKNTVAKKTARIATYLSVPISVLEYFMFGTPYSILIGVVGTTAQWITDQSDSKKNWLFVAR